MTDYSPFFAAKGVHALVDGQFGSTGKGLFASYLARESVKDNYHFLGVISNAGPNSGHTFYHEGEKHVLKQLPTFAVKRALMGYPTNVFLSAGAIIDPTILFNECEKYEATGIEVYVHRNAAIIDAEQKKAEQSGTIAAVAGTRSGTGAAIARKVQRDPNAIFASLGWDFVIPRNLHIVNGEEWLAMTNPYDGRFFMEVSQGFSLGLNDDFYPKVTSRECTVAQALADARIHPHHLAKTFMVIRTFPIRVGNVDGHSSGDHYQDQQELEWETDFPNVTPERTTVTNRVRRIFTFSQEQYRQSLIVNRPDYVLVNFMNYLDPLAQRSFTDNLTITETKAGVMPQRLYGWGPNDDEITPF